MLKLEILVPLDGSDLAAGLAERPFLNPGSLTVAAGAKGPRWLPPGDGTVYLAENGDLYALAKGAGGKASPRKVGTLAEHLFGKELAERRLTHASSPGFIFETYEAKALSACIEDEETDMPASKCRRQIEAGKRIYFTHVGLERSLLRSARFVARRNAGTKPRGGERPWTLDRLFGQVH